MAKSDLVEQFVAQELTPYIRGVLWVALQEAANSEKILIRQFEFNLFDVLFDFSREVVVVQDVLSSGDQSAAEVSISDFVSLCGLSGA
jgi:hypothetical protein